MYNAIFDLRETDTVKLWHGPLMRRLSNKLVSWQKVRFHNCSLLLFWFDMYVLPGDRR